MQKIIYINNRSHQKICIHIYICIYICTHIYVCMCICMHFLIPILINNTHIVYYRNKKKPEAPFAVCGEKAQGAEDL